MTLTKPTIIKWYNSYNEDLRNDSKSERKILSSMGTVKSWKDFKGLLQNRKDGILKWKGALRNIGYYDSLIPTSWQKLFDIVKGSTNNPREAVKDIVRFSKEKMIFKTKSGRILKGGINYPVASTLAYFFSRGRCPIVDWRAVSALKNSGYAEELKKVRLYYYQIFLASDGWNDYYDICHTIVSKMDIQSVQSDTPIRVLDKALWKLGGEPAIPKAFH